MDDPHRNAPVFRSGPEIAQARIAGVALHGRGGSAEDILSLAEEIGGANIAWLAPQAAAHSWYPNSFLAPIEQNEPWLSSALSAVERAVQLCVAAGVPRERIVLCGFSQGACLATEFAARHPARYGALIAFTGGLIGPPNADLHHEGSLAATPVLLSSGDPDPHVPWSRVDASAREFERMGAEVRLMRFPGRPHTITAQELDAAKALVSQLFIAGAGTRS